jgi:hypothetical protein
MATAEERLSELFEEAMWIAAVARESNERATESLCTAEEHVKDLKRVASRAREAVALSRAIPRRDIPLPTRLFLALRRRFRSPLVAGVADTC